jgi:pimeloyl-ACP methyl ester carboxylesterase
VDIQPNRLTIGVLLCLVAIAPTGAAARHCAIAVWGDTISCSHVPRQVPSPNTDFIAVSVGGCHFLGLKAQGNIVAWGSNLAGQLNVPEPNADFIACSAGANFSLGLKANGSIVPWGYMYGYDMFPPPPNRDFVAISAGNRYALALRSNGIIAAWGDPNFCNVPSPNSQWIAVSAGEGHCLGLKANGSVVAWGDNTFGQCNVPPPNNGFVAIAAGCWWSMALREDGSVVCWGDNRGGQCDVPPPNTGFVMIAAGGIARSEGMKEDGSIVEWGYLEGLGIPEPNSGFVAIDTNGLCAGLRGTGEILARDPGTGSSIAAKWWPAQANQGDLTQAYLTDRPGGQCESFCLESPLVPEVGGDSTVFLFEGLDPYERYYLSFRTKSLGGEWSRYITCDPDSAIYPSVPTFLVHGLNSDAAAWGTQDNGPLKWLHDRHVSYEYAVPGMDPQGVVGERMFEGNAERLAGFITHQLGIIEGDNRAFAGREIRCNTVDIIGHSMGGLIARRYLSGFNGDVTCRKLVMLASPNRGSKAADYACGTWGDMWPAYCELGTREMAEFNWRFPGVGETKVYTAAGTGGLVEEDIWPVGLILVPGCSGMLKLLTAWEDWPNDGIVSLGSAFGYPGAVDATWLDSDHGQVLCHSPLLDNWGTQNVFDYWVLPILTDPNRESLERPAPPPVQTEEPQVTFRGCGQVTLGGQANRQLRVEGATFSIGMVSSEPGVLLDLVSPSGAVWDPEHVEQDPMVQYTAADRGRSYFFMNGEPGLWTARLSGDSLGVPQAGYCLFATVQDSIRLTTSLNKSTFISGDSVIVSGRLAEAGQPITGGSMGCSVVNSEEDTVATGLMFDDGAHRDADPNDGIYGCTFLAWNEGGAYSFVVKVDGTSPDAGAFHREGEEVVYIDRHGAGIDGPKLVGGDGVLRISPNPSSGSVVIDYSLLHGALMRCDIYDVGGRRVRSLMAGDQQPGTIHITWDGLDNQGKRVGSGVYTARFGNGTRTESRKIIILR